MGAGLRIGGASVLAVTVFLVGAVRTVEPARREVVPVLEADALATRTSKRSFSGRIAALQGRLRVAPSDWRAAAELGLVYVNQVRLTANPTLLSRAEQALRRSLSLRSESVEGLVGMGFLSLARHDFNDALAWGRRAVSANEYGVAAYGVMGDALMELGRYGRAFRTFQRMADVRPGLAAYARASYARELQGDLSGAIRLMRMAEEAAGAPDDAAWAAFELGNLFWSRGRLPPAEAAYRRAVRLAPAFVPPRAGLARVSWARGRLDEAARRYRWVVARFPSPEHVAALGDLYAVTGRRELAQEQFALVRAIQDLFEANGVNVDLELALFDADHGRPRAALRAARDAWSARKSVHAADTLAWALHVNGRSREAARYARTALRLGTRNPLFFLHAGMIQLRLGHEGRARAFLSRSLRMNPRFSILYANTARRLLNRLEAV
jgi:tetratricopeptide (TPR) repeat protein